MPRPPPTDRWKTLLDAARAGDLGAATQADLAACLVDLADALEGRPPGAAFDDTRQVSLRLGPGHAANARRAADALRSDPRGAHADAADTLDALADAYAWSGKAPR